MKAPIIITVNKTTSEIDYLIEVTCGSMRDNLAYLHISKDVAYDRIISFCFKCLVLETITDILMMLETYLLRLQHQHPKS